MGRSKRTLAFKSIENSYFFYVAYSIIIFVFALCIWPNMENREFEMYQYNLDLNYVKISVGFVFSLIAGYIIYRRYSVGDSFSKAAVFLLSALYFIPGCAIISALNVEWGYIFSFFVYFLVLVGADYFTPKPMANHVVPQKMYANYVLWPFILICLLYPFVMMAVYNKSMSIADFLLTINDPYGVRAQAREQGISWAFLLVENWAVYFGALMITYSIKKRKIALSVFFILSELFYFSLQGNRIYLFITGVAFVLGFVKVNEKKLIHVLLVLFVIQLVEYMSLKQFGSVGFVSNAFRRFSIVPNIISTKYYDFFQTAVPDFLRGNYPSISSFIGSPSPYDFNVGYLIGKEYFGMELNANTGMVGGAFFEFGIFGIIIDPIMMVVALRLFDNVLIKADKEINMISALIFSSLAINSWAIWSQCFRISYVPLLLISMYFLVNQSDRKIVYYNINCGTKKNEYHFKNN